MTAMKLGPLLAFAVSSSLLACSTSEDGPAAYAPPPASSVVEVGPRAIRREILELAGVVAPPNPQGGAATPPEQNRIRVVRYRVDTTPPRAARAVFVLMPGFLAGAGSFDGLARAIVRRSDDVDAFEAWAIDRRSNLLEDTHGLDVAEVRESGKPAYAYYIDGDPLEGKTFAGFTRGPEAPWASEWGLATTVGDLRKVIELVAPEERKKRVVLLGHSLGASIVEEYAAWDFGGPGFDDLAALVLADGVTQNEGAPANSVSQSAYENGDPSSPGFPSPGVVKDIRGGNTFTTIPLLGVEALAVAEAVAIDARYHPLEVQTSVPGRDNLLQVALGLTTLPRLTNRAAFGMAFDEGSAPLSFAAARCGAPTGGSLGSYTGPFGGSLVHPTDPSATYDWTDGPEVGEPSRLADLATAWFLGPGVNFAEWYFPTRLAVDASAAGSLVITDDDWRSATYGLRARHGAAIDVPIFAAAFRLVGTASAFDKLRVLVAPVGAGRPLSGRPRTDPDAFLAKEYRDLAHIDGLVGADLPGGAAAAFYDDLLAFVRKQTPDGGVTVPVMR
jgi:hypothetical protein